MLYNHFHIIIIHLKKCTATKAAINYLLFLMVPSKDFGLAIGPVKSSHRYMCN